MKTCLLNLAITFLLLTALRTSAQAQTYGPFSGNAASFGWNDQDAKIIGPPTNTTGGTNGTVTGEAIVVDSVNGALQESGTWTMPAFSISFTMPLSYTAPPVFPNPPVTYTGHETFTITLDAPVSNSFNSGPQPLTFVSGSTFIASGFATVAINVPFKFDLSIYTDSDGVTFNEPEITQTIPIEFGERTTISTASFPASINPVVLNAGFASFAPTQFTFPAYTAPNGMPSNATITVPEPTAIGLLGLVAAPLLLLRRFRSGATR
jgi:hypothetical protein